MILVDTSVWVDHLRSGDRVLARLLDDSHVLAHPWVIGEFALGRLRNRREIIDLLENLPSATLATPAEILLLIEESDLAGRGIGYVAVQLLAATRLTPDARIWTRDRRLASVAAHLGVAFEPADQ